MEQNSEYIKRIRLEKSAHILGVMKKSITDTAMECGFNSSEQFSREFKNYFGFSPSDLNRIKKQNRENGIAESMEKIISKRKFCEPVLSLEFMKKLKPMEVEVVNSSKIELYYKRYRGRYGVELQQFIIKFIEEIREFSDIESEQTKLCGIIYDNPNISDEEKCRFDVCISKESVKGLKDADEKYGSITIQEGDYAKFKYIGTSEEVGLGYAWIYGVWFPKSIYEPEDRLGHHIYKKFKGYEEPFECEIYVPVKKVYR